MEIPFSAAHQIILGVDPFRDRVNNACTMAQNLADKKLAVLGTGKLGGILLRAYLKQGCFRRNVTATVSTPRKRRPRERATGFVTTDNRKAVHGADIVLLGVKPQVMGEVLQGNCVGV